MTTAADIATAVTDIALVVDANTKAALTAVVAVLNDLLTTQNADITANAATAALATANAAAIAANPYIALSQKTGIASTASLPYQNAPSAGVQDADPALVVTVPGRISAASTQDKQLIAFVTAGTLPAGTHAVAYNQTLVAGGGYGSGYVYTAVGTQVNGQSIGSVLPLGMTLSGAGVLAGTPTVAGVYFVVITATDPAGNAVSQAFSLTIA